MAKRKKNANWKFFKMIADANSGKLPKFYQPTEMEALKIFYEAIKQRQKAD